MKTGNVYTCWTSSIHNGQQCASHPRTQDITYERNQSFASYLRLGLFSVLMKAHLKWYGSITGNRIESYAWKVYPMLFSLSFSLEEILDIAMRKRDSAAFLSCRLRRLKARPTLVRNWDSSATSVQAIQSRSAAPSFRDDTSIHKLPHLLPRLS